MKHWSACLSLAALLFRSERKQIMNPILKSRKLLSLIGLVLAMTIVQRKAAAVVSGEIAVDPDTHHAYLPLQNVGGQPVLREIVLEPQGGG
jgi:hypothetical protein